MRTPPDEILAMATQSIGRERANVRTSTMLAWVNDSDPTMCEVLYIEARKEGRGWVGPWIDALPGRYPGRRIVFPNVVNDRLAGMLERRGYRMVHGLREVDRIGLVLITMWVLKPSTAAAASGTM